MDADARTAGWRVLAVEKRTWLWTFVAPADLEALWPLVLAVDTRSAAGWRREAEHRLDGCSHHRPGHREASAGVIALHTASRTAVAAFLYAVHRDRDRLQIERMRHLEFGARPTTLAATLHLTLELAAHLRCREIALHTPRGDRGTLERGLHACALSCGFFERRGLWLSRLPCTLDTGWTQS
ncbi:MAG: hypothetical protein KDE35_00745 [Geminicoccaceae bacterium]|nr:hypothetical protein [Geminicoccaceae bacterium]